MYIIKIITVSQVEISIHFKRYTSQKYNIIKLNEIIHNYKKSGDSRLYEIIKTEQTTKLKIKLINLLKTNKVPHNS